MEEVYLQQQSFDRKSMLDHLLAKGEYEECIFSNCDLSGKDLSGFSFEQCSFHGCNLSMARLVKTAFRGCTFTDCKMLGMGFDSCSQFGFSITLHACLLNHSSFYQMKMKKTMFIDCALQEVDFIQSDLAGAVFDKCDLALAKFDNTILEQADFRTAYNYNIDLDINKIKRARFSQSGLSGLLGKYHIDIDPLG